jgi:hypothetical protein
LITPAVPRIFFNLTRNTRVILGENTAEVEWLSRDVLIITPKWKKMRSLRLEQEGHDQLDKIVRAINIRRIQRGEKPITRTQLLARIVSKVVSRPELLSEILR